MFGVNNVNIRAFYKKMYGKVDNSKNDRLYYIGVISMISLPMIGVFDMYKWSKYHGVFAVTFFLTFGVYSVLLGRAMYSAKDKFPESEQESIATLRKNTNGLVTSLLLLGLSALLHGPTPLFEWITVLYFVNFFAIMAFTNPFYDSVHEEGTLIKND